MSATRRVVPLVLVAALLCGPAAAVSPLEARQDLDVAALERAAGALPKLHSLLVHARGTLVFERYYHGARADRPANIKSASKSVIAALVGIALAEKRIPAVREPPRISRRWLAIRIAASAPSPSRICSPCGPASRAPAAGTTAAGCRAATGCSSCWRGR